MPISPIWMLFEPFRLCLALTFAIVVWAIGLHVYELQNQLTAETLRLIVEHVLVDGWYRGFTDHNMLFFAFETCLIIMTGGALARLEWPRRGLEWLADKAAFNGNAWAALIISAMAVLT